MKQKSVGLTLRVAILALALILVAGSPALPPFDGVAYAQTTSVSTLSSSNLPNGNLQLDWTAVANADEYRLWKGEGSGSTVVWENSATTIDAPTIMSVDSAVTAGMTYSYVVEVYDGTTRLGWSNVINVTIPGGTQAPTAKPTVTLAADGLTAITVTWTDVPGADHYRVRYWTSGLSGWMDLATQKPASEARTLSHTGLTPGTQYFYIVRGENDGGNGPYSGSPGNYDSLTLESTTTEPVLTLTHPERLRVELSWTRTSTTATYQVQRMKAVTRDGVAVGDLAEAWDDIGAAQSGNTYSDTTVTYGADDNDATTAEVVVYSYRVQATQNGEQGDYSNVRTATIPADDSLPPVPAGLSPTAVSSSRINVAWSPAAGATSHQIQFKVGDGNYGSAMTVTAPYLHTNLSANTEYTYQVRSVNVNGHSAWSAAKSVTTLVATARGDRLATPTGLTAVDATADIDGTLTPRVKVTWNASAKATSYELRKWNGTTWAALTLTAEDQTNRSHTDSTGVTAGMTYYYIVAALADFNEPATPDVTTDDDMSDWSSPAMAMTVAVKPAAAPAGLAATARGENRIWVSWSAVEGATEYVLQWRTTGSSNWNTVTVSDGLTYAHTGRSAGTKYHYQVAAKNSGGMSAFSAEVSETTWARALSTPTGLMAEDATDGTSARIKLTWNAVSGADAYEIQRWSGTAWVTIQLDTDTDGTPQSPAVTQTSMTSYTDTESTLAAGMTYHYIVRAVSGDVTSSWTSDVSGMTKPTAPTELPVLHLDPTGQTTVRLTWAPASGDTAAYTGWELQYVKGAATADNLNLAGFQKMSMTLPATPMYDTMSNLEVGTLYSFRIRGTLAQGVMGAWSNVGQIITRPATPQLTASSVSSTSIKLTWTHANPPGFLAADALTGEDYELQRRKTGETTWATVATATATCASGECSITDEPSAPDALEGNMTYFYRIRVSTEPTGTVTGHPRIKSYWSNASARTPN